MTSDRLEIDLENAFNDRIAVHIGRMALVIAQRDVEISALRGEIVRLTEELKALRAPADVE